MTKTSKEPIRIILLNNLALVRAGLRLIIESQPVCRWWERWEI